MSGANSFSNADINNPSHGAPNYPPALLREEGEKIADLVPKMLMAAHTAAANMLVGEHLLKKVGHGQNFWQFREYDTHDRPQDIDWRQSAKSDRLYIRERERQTAQTLLLWADNNPGMFWRSDKTLPTKRRVAEILVLALAILSVDNGEMFRLFEDGAKPGRSDKTLETLAIRLLEKHADKNTAHNDTLAILNQVEWTRRSIPVLIGDFLEPVEDMRSTISYLSDRGQGGVIVQVFDPAELDLPYQGRVDYQDMKGNGSELIENVGAIRQDYQQRLSAHRTALRDMVERNGWQFFDIRTDQPLYDLVRLIWLYVSTDALEGKREGLDAR